MGMTEIVKRTGHLGSKTVFPPLPHSTFEIGPHPVKPQPKVGQNGLEPHRQFIEVGLTIERDIEPVNQQHIPEWVSSVSKQALAVPNCSEGAVNAARKRSNRTLWRPHLILINDLVRNDLNLAVALRAPHGPDTLELVDIPAELTTHTAMYVERSALLHRKENDAECETVEQRGGGQTGVIQKVVKDFNPALAITTNVIQLNDTPREWLSLDLTNLKMDWRIFSNHDAPRYWVAAVGGTDDRAVSPWLAPPHPAYAREPIHH
jgi:hypothetical protein